MNKRTVKIFLELQYYIIALMFIDGFLIIIEVGLSRDRLLLERYNLFVLLLDMLKAWFAIYVMLPWFTKQEDFLPGTWHKFWAALYLIVFLDNFWVTGPWGLGR